MQAALDQGIAMVEEKVQRHAEQAMMVQASPAAPEPEDDGHEETVEEVRAKMRKAQETMNAGIQNAEDKSA